MPFSIYPATVSDVEKLRDLAIRTFYDTFAEGSDPDDMSAYIETAFSQIQIQREILDVCNLFFLLFPAEEDVPFGYAKLRQGTTEVGVSGVRPIELERLYVDKSVLRQGYGSALMRAAIAKAQALDHDVLWLGVWEHNVKAIAFYQRWGFEKVGSHPFVVGEDHQTDWVMQRSI